MQIKISERSLKLCQDTNCDLLHDRPCYTSIRHSFSSFPTTMETVQTGNVSWTYVHTVFFHTYCSWQIQAAWLEKIHLMPLSSLVVYTFSMLHLYQFITGQVFDRIYFCDNIHYLIFVAHSWMVDCFKNMLCWKTFPTNFFVWWLDIL